MRRKPLLYESVRIPRTTARIVWSTREMGRFITPRGVERRVRNLLWKGNRRQSFYRGMGGCTAGKKITSATTLSTSSPNRAHG